MPIGFRCPQCGHTLAANDGREGSLIRCPRCRETVTVPTANGASMVVDVGEEETLQISAWGKILAGGVAVFAIVVSVIVIASNIEPGRPSLERPMINRPAPANAVSADPFSKFEWAVDELNRRVVAKGGVRLFDGARGEGDGIVVVTATDAWLSAGYESERRSNLNTLFEIWQTIEGSGHPVAVYVEDRDGNVVMRRSN